MESKQQGSLAWVSREAWAVCIAATVLALAFSPRNAASLTALVAVGLWPVIIVSLRWRDMRLTSAISWVLGIAAVPVVIVVVRSVFAADARVSLIGSVGQHAGSLTWLAAWAVLAAAVTTARPSDLGRSARGIAIAAAVLAIAGGLDRLGVFAALRFSAEPSGFMENSVSLAQVLLVGLGCAVAWGFASAGRQRVGGLVGAVVIFAGLVLADSAGAWVGVAVGAAVGAGSYFMLRRRGRWPVWVATGLAVAMVVVIGTLVVVLLDGVDTGVETTLAQASNDRFTIWTSAVSQFKRAPVFGEGSEQFSAWVRWDLEPGPTLVKTGTYDPHNLGLWWLLAGGILALAAATAAATVLLWRSLELLAARRSLAVASLVAVVVGWVVAAMFAWTSVLALALVAVVVGLLVGLSASSDSAARSVTRLILAAPVAAAALGLAAVVVLFLAGAHHEYSWARRVDAGTSEPLRLVQAAQATRDPSLAALSITDLFAAAGQGSVDSQTARESAAALTSTLEDASPWHVDATFARFQIASSSGPSEESWTDIETAIADGEQADPTSGLWAAMGALQAQAWGRGEDAKRYAEQALSRPLSPSARGQLESLLR